MFLQYKIYPFYIRPQGGDKAYDYQRFKVHQAACGHHEIKKQRIITEHEVSEDPYSLYVTEGLAGVQMEARRSSEADKGNELRQRIHSDDQAEGNIMLRNKFVF